MVTQAKRWLSAAALVALFVAAAGLVASSCTFGTGPIDDYRCDVDGDCLSLESCIEGFCVIGTDGGAATAANDAAAAETTAADEMSSDAGALDAAAED